MKDAQCAETNKKLIFRFLVFGICSFKFNQLAKIHIFIRKDTLCSETNFLVNEYFLFLVIFNFSDMVDFVLNIRIELVWDLEIFANLNQKR